jgi:xylan 1,4-beta-xylosidase
VGAHRQGRDPRRRQRHLSATVSTRVDASAGAGGLASSYGEDHWFAVEARGDGTSTTVTARAQPAGLDRSWSAELLVGEVELRMELTPPPSDFSAGAVGGDRIRLVAKPPDEAGGEDVVLTELDGRYWTFEVAKSFTGRVVGLYAAEGTVTFADYRCRGSDQTQEIPA